MKVAFFFIFLSATFTAISAICQGCIEGVCYTKATIFEGFQMTGQLAIDRTENILYFHFENSGRVDFTGSFNLNDIRFQLLPSFAFTFAHAIDQSTHDVYLSGPTGIKKYNPSANITTNLGLRDKTIWHLQYKDKLYYVEFLTPGLFTYENKESKSISALANYTIDDFVIDKQDDIYFMNDFTVYRLRKGASAAQIFVDDIYSLSTDKDGNIYFVQPATRGIYKLDYKSDKLIEVGAFDSGNPFRVIFDSDNNLIYHDVAVDKLYHLTPNYGHCRVNTKGKGKSRKVTVVAEAA